MNTVLLWFEFSRKFTSPSCKLRKWITEFTSLRAKSTSLSQGLLDMILFACCLKLCFKRILMAKKFVQKWPNFFIKYCDFFLKQQWHPLFSFSFFLCWHKNKKGKMQLHKCWYNSFFICPSESYTVVLLSCFPSGFTSISQAHDNADYVNTKYMN